MKKSFILFSIICLNTTVFAQDSGITKFRHTLFVDENESITHNSAKAAKFDLLGGVHAKIDENGEIIFNNNSYEAVVAYIHNEKGDVVDKVIIPPTNESLFTVTYSAIKEIPHLPINSTIEKSNNSRTKLETILSGDTNTTSFESGIYVSNFPKNGAISYAIGTEETILSTALSVPLKVITSSLLLIDDKYLSSDTVQKNIQKSLISLASDTDTYNKIITEVRNNNMGNVVELSTKWFKEKGLAEFSRNMAKDGLENYIPSFSAVNEVFDSLKFHEYLANQTIALSQLQNAATQSQLGPLLLYTDMPLYSDKEQGQIALPQLFNWNNTALEEKYSERYWSPFTNEYDSAGKWYNPTTWWSAPANAEAQRWALTSESKEAQDYINYLKSQKGISCADNPNMGMCLPNKTNIDMLNNLNMNTQDRTSHFGATAYLNKFNSNQNEAHNRQTSKENFYNEPIMISGATAHTSVTGETSGSAISSGTPIISTGMGTGATVTNIETQEPF